MSVVIAYQSLHSSSSHEHDVSASTGMPLQVATHKKYSSLYPSGGGLVYPTNPDLAPEKPILGPAEIKKVAPSGHIEETAVKKRKIDETEPEFEQRVKRARQDMLGMTEGKARQIHQMAFRSVHQQCDLMVFGELDTSHQSWQTLANHAGPAVHRSVQQMTSNCFSVHRGSSSATFVAEGKGWCAVKVKSVLAVFVHVPNDIALDKDRNVAVKFYKDIKSALLSACGGVADIIMGDTNQQAISFSPSVISEGMDGSFKDGHTGGKKISPVDTWAQKQVVHKGTNSGNSKLFDVVIYNTATVKSIEVKYFSQLSSVQRSPQRRSAAYTDHMGLLAKVEKK